MKPLGQKPKKFNYEDCHPPKGFVNWWEDICDEDKTEDKREWKKRVEKELQDGFYL